MKYDNCKNCTSNCEHAGKDREFVCINGISCKVVSSRKSVYESRACYIAAGAIDKFEELRDILKDKNLERFFTKEEIVDYAIAYLGDILQILNH